MRYRSTLALGAGAVVTSVAMMMMMMWSAPAAAASSTPDYVASSADGAGEVPEVSAEWYRDVVDFAAETPSWVQSFAGFFTEAAIVAMAGLMLLCWWRARKKDARSMALALLGPVAVVLAYGVSAVAKRILQEPRPCRTFAEVSTIIDCPAPGDWAFPSNHSVIVGAAMVGIVLAWRGLGVLAAVLAVGAAASRVFVGAHYPHDVVVGFVLGMLVAIAISFGLLRWVTTVVTRLREQRLVGTLLATPDPAEDPEWTQQTTQVLPRQDPEWPDSGDTRS